MTRVLVVDDNELIRTGLVTVINSDPDLEVVGQASSGPEGVSLARRDHPDVVLMDIEMPGGDGISATATLAAAADGPRVLILTMFDLDEYVVEGLRAGASGFLIKTTPPAELIAAVKACAAGQLTVGPTVMERLVGSYTHRGTPESHPGLARLTERETDVLLAMSKGLSNAEIGGELWMAETTVKTHVARILAKLQVRDRVQAVVLAHRHGLADSE
ncbi:LuxR family transcriptional regulator [Knoellia sinensis KCTC 19936]|uniref:LuxR family transcriptional regulator n=1 Tax=Knoellia sinensis KCTC 19936 TaxID=1385520 RepID=A0A0A0J5I7_9MICO|nr:response regulator transcription factor [Knoellia sinensis]KGN31362.1 LuxR family transcriptional regulator [Knoellia sinensis KCTC 19936]